VISEFGAYALILALALAVLQTVMATAGRIRRSPVLAGAAQGAAIASACAVALAFAALIFAFVTSDFSVANVANNSHTDKPPLMDGQFIPNGLFNFDPPWLAFFELPTMIQFQHRMVAYAIAGASIVLWWATLRATPIPRVRLMAHALLACVLAQVALGIWTLLAIVPTELAAAHQAMAVVLLGLALALAFELRWHGLGAPRFLPVAPARGSAQAAASA